MPLRNSTDLHDLPNELILHILQCLNTTSVLPLARISSHFYSLVTILFRQRLRLAANPRNHTILLECYHPSRRLMEPQLYCDYLGTEGLDDGEGSAGEGEEVEIGLGELGGLRECYSRFRPYRHPTRRRPQLRHPAGDVPGSRTHPATPLSSTSYPTQEENISQSLTLEDHERFGQLVANVNLVQMGPKPGLFLAFIGVEEGVIRVFKDWLRRASVLEDGDGNGEGEDGTMLWVNDGKHVGLKTRVTERRWRGAGAAAPILMRADEDEEACTFDVGYQELRIRTSHLLLKLEKSLQQQASTDGKAVVFGTFGSTAPLDENIAW